MAVVEEGGRQASTYYEVIERLRRLQLRAVPAALRPHPSDPRAHGVESVTRWSAIASTEGRQRGQLPDGAPDPARQCLHAWSLSLKHPRTHEPMVFDAPIPHDIERLLRWFRRSQ